jgi:flavin-dependent dehydrogenase
MSTLKNTASTGEGYDVVIIGAGPAGTIAASVLQREGFRIIVLEKQQFPRFVIGESLLPRCMNLLEEAGLLAAIKAQKFMTKMGAVFLRGGETCDFDFSQQSADGWPYTFQVVRADFDKTLADAVASRGVEICYNHAVTAVRFEGDGAQLTVEGPDRSKREINAKFIIDASGYGRVLPTLLDLHVPSKQAFREALFTHVTGDHRPAGKQEGKIWVCIHPQGAWIWIIPFSNGKTSVGVVATPQFYQAFPGEPDTQLRSILMSDPNAAKRLAEMEFVFPAKWIKGYSCSVKKLFGPRFVLAGNATEFLDPVFSSGVTLAMESGMRAAKTVVRQLRGENPNWQTEYADHLMQGVNTFRVYVDAWYDGTLAQIFFSSNRDPDVMEKICSVLAGYVWDKSNPYVTQAKRALSLISQLVAEN